MSLFALFCVDKPDALALRLATREAHLAYVGGFRDQMKLGGPLLDEAGEMAGSLIVVDVADLAAAQAFSASDPYTKAGLWARVDIKAFKATLGQL